MAEYLDTRDLYTEWQDLQTRDDDEEDTDPLDEGETDRLRELAELFAEIGEDTGRYGVALIPESEFPAYVQELAEDINGVDASAWPFNNIDWEAAADDLRVDYTAVSFDGDDYLIRLG